MLAPGDPMVAGWIEQARAFGNGPRPSPAAAALRAASTALHERPCWLAEPLTRASFPKLVILGGDPGLLATVGATTADRIGARLVRVPGAAHDPHRDRPDVVNELLSDLWSGAF